MIELMEPVMNRRDFPQRPTGERRTLPLKPQDLARSIPEESYQVGVSVLAKQLDGMDLEFRLFSLGKHGRQGTFGILRRMLATCLWLHL